jgi:hypothetical protein
VSPARCACVKLFLYFVLSVICTVQYALVCPCTHFFSAAHVCACTHTHTFTQMPTQAMYSHEHAHTLIYAHTHMHTLISTHTYAHTYAHTYTHIHSQTNTHVCRLEARLYSDADPFIAQSRGMIDSFSKAQDSGTGEALDFCLKKNDQINCQCTPVFCEALTHANIHTLPPARIHTRLCLKRCVGFAVRFLFSNLTAFLV